MAEARRRVEAVLSACSFVDRVPVRTVLDEYQAIFKRHDAESAQEEEEFEVEDILDEDGFNFKIKWVGYPVSASTWEPAAACEGCEDLIAEFRKRKKADSSSPPKSDSSSSRRRRR